MCILILSYLKYVKIYIGECLSCFAHLLKLVVRDELKKTESSRSALAKCRKLLNLVHQTSKVHGMESIQTNSTGIDFKLQSFKLMFQHLAKTITELSIHGHICLLLWEDCISSKPWIKGASKNSLSSLRREYCLSFTKLYDRMEYNVPGGKADCDR